MCPTRGVILHLILPELRLYGCHPHADVGANELPDQRYEAGKPGAIHPIARDKSDLRQALQWQTP